MPSTEAEERGGGAGGTHHYRGKLEGGGEGRGSILSPPGEGARGGGGGRPLPQPCWRWRARRRPGPASRRSEKRTTTPGTTAGATCCGRGRCATPDDGEPRGRRASPCSTCSSGRGHQRLLCGHPLLRGHPSGGRGLVRAYTQVRQGRPGRRGHLRGAPLGGGGLPCPYSFSSGLLELEAHGGALGRWSTPPTSRCTPCCPRSGQRPSRPAPELAAEEWPPRCAASLPGGAPDTSMNKS